MGRTKLERPRLVHTLRVCTALLCLIYQVDASQTARVTTVKELVRYLIENGTPGNVPQKSIDTAMKKVRKEFQDDSDSADQLTNLQALLSDNRIINMLYTSIFYSSIPHLFLHHPKMLRIISGLMNEDGANFPKIQNDENKELIKLSIEMIRTKFTKVGTYKRPLFHQAGQREVTR